MIFDRIYFPGVNGAPGLWLCIGPGAWTYVWEPVAPAKRAA